jgi:hypothetical protein
MNFSVMDYIIFIVIVVILGLCFKLWSFSIRIESLAHKIEQKEMEINHLEHKLKTKEVDFNLYKHRSDLEKIQTAEDVSKSLFVLNNKPKFEKGYNCDEFFVIEVEPKIFYGSGLKTFKDLPTDKIEKLLKISGIVLNVFCKVFENGIVKSKLDEIKNKTFEVYYSYTVFSKLDQKTMVVREEYLEAFRENHMKELSNNNQTKS